MAGNRAQVESFIIEMVEKLNPGASNREAYQELFKSMDDEAFDAWMKKLKTGEIKLCILAPNQNKSKMSIEKNMQVAKELGHDFRERIWMDPKGGSAPYLTNYKYMLVDLPICRQAQLLIKKISLPESNSTVDFLTGQPVGASKGSKISYMELQILASKGLDKTTEELIKYRGGDLGGFNAMNDMIAKTGEVSLAAIEHLATGVESTKTLKTYLTCMHLDPTL